MPDLRYELRPTKTLVTKLRLPCIRCCRIDYLTADELLCEACNSGGVVVDRRPPPEYAIRYLPRLPRLEMVERDELGRAA